MQPWKMLLVLQLLVLQARMLQLRVQWRTTAADGQAGVDAHPPLVRICARRNRCSMVRC